MQALERKQGNFSLRLHVPAILINSQTDESHNDNVGEPEGERMKIVVNWSLCEGNGNCEAAAPELFQLDDEDELHVLNANPPEDMREKAEAAVRSCPKTALSIEE